MVSQRCKILVKEVLKTLGLHFIFVELGEVEIMENMTDSKWLELKTILLMTGLELMENKKAILIEKIKAVVIEMIHSSTELPNINYSDFISNKLHHDYTYLSNIFSEAKGITIQQFIIVHKIERVKELIIYDELTISEIAWKLNYSSTAHLSNQFKKITGLTPSHFKTLKNKRRTALEEVGNTENKVHCSQLQ